MGDSCEDDFEMAWRLQQEEVTSVAGIRMQNDEQCSPVTNNDASAVASSTTADPRNDEEVARAIDDRQVAYRLQMELDEEMARSLRDEENTCRPTQDNVDAAIAQGHGGPQGRGGQQGRRVQVHRHQGHMNQNCGDPFNQMLGLIGRGVGGPGFDLGQMRVIPIGGMAGGAVPMDYDGLMDLAERIGEARNPGLNKEQLNTLPTQVFHSSKLSTDSSGSSESDEDKQCKVCLEDFKDGEDLRTLPCCHKYHKQCIDHWLQRRATCPVCKLEVKDELSRHVP